VSSAFLSLGSTRHAHVPTMGSAEAMQVERVVLNAVDLLTWR